MKDCIKIYEAELASIREAGTYKDERIITTPQRSRIDTTAAPGVLNMCANNYLGLADNPEIIAAPRCLRPLGLWPFLRALHLRHPADPQGAGSQAGGFPQDGGRHPLLFLL